jgi:Flp pilus assembly protein TadD
VLADDPTNVEALTYKGWLQFQSGDSAGIESLIAAAEADPDYAPTHAFLAVILEQAGRTDAALAELDRLDALDPPPYILELVAGMRARLEAAAAATPTTAPAP